MGRILFIFVLICLVSAAASPVHSEDRVRKGNEAFSAGNFQEAIAQYQSLADNGYGSFELYYNLGNAYFKQGQMPAAILYYEKARKLNPNDDDLLFNLRVANSRIKDKIDILPRLFFIYWWEDLRNMYNTDRWALGVVASFIGLLFCALIFLFSKMIAFKKTSFYAGLLLLAVFLLSNVMAYQQYGETNKTKSAIVFEPTVNIKSAPDENSTDLFVVHEGLKVLILDRINTWYRIRIQDGSDGWVEEQSVKII